MNGPGQRACLEGATDIHHGRTEVILGHHCKVVVLGSDSIQEQRERHKKLSEEKPNSCLFSIGICIASLLCTKMIENEAFSSFAFFGTLLVIKMYIIAIITGQVRLRKKAFANPEDALRHGGLEYCRDDLDVDRCLRAHRNDMENIYTFLFLGGVYTLIDPNPAVARIHFLIFFLGRVLHTIAYLLQLRAPIRSWAYSMAQIPCFSMAVQILCALKYW